MSHAFRNTCEMGGSFEEFVSDVNIDVPKIVKNRISRVISIHFKFELQKQ